MNNFEKRALYESVMTRVSKIVKSKLMKKQHINENSERMPFVEYLDKYATLDTFNNTRNNEKWERVLPNDIILSDNKIGFAFTAIYSDDGHKFGKFAIMRDSLGEALDDFSVVLVAFVSSKQKLTNIECSKVINTLRKAYFKLLTEAEIESIDERAEILADTINNAKSDDDLMKIFADI